MLEVKKLNIKNIEEGRLLISNLSFVANKGDKIAVIGEEGNGKSTLLKAIYHQDLLGYCEITGEIKYHGIIGYLPQDILKEYGDINVIDFLMLKHPTSLIDTSDYELLGKLDVLLNDMCFNEDSFNDNKCLKQFSGGELVKLGLIKILLHNPDLIILDEPTNDLDLQTILFLEEFIIKEERPIIFVSHDESLLRNTANAIIHLNQTKKKKNPESSFSKMDYVWYKQTRFKRLASQDMIARQERSDFKQKQEKLNQIYQKVCYQQNQAVRQPSLGRLLKKKMHVLKSQERKLEKDKNNFLEIPEFDEYINLFFDANVEIQNGKKIIDFHLDELKNNNRVLARNIDLCIKGGEKIVIIGNNGVGKTTLLLQIFENLKNRQDINPMYMPQRYEDVLDDEELALHVLCETGDKIKEAEIRKIMGSALFTPEEMLYKNKMLSGGQKAKLLIMKAIVNKCNVLLLDEPTRNISPLSSEKIYSLFKSFKGAIICVTHDRAFIESVFDGVYELKSGGIFKLL